MIRLTKEDHAAAAALASRMKAEFASVPPKISIAAVHMLQLEIAVHLSAGNKKAALDYLKAMAHDARDSIRAYFRAVEGRKAREAAEIALADALAGGTNNRGLLGVIDEAPPVPHALALGTQETK